LKETIKELGSLCKMAAEFEHKWDQAGKDYLGTRMTNVEYTEFVEQYLNSVRRLESALSSHLVAVTYEAAQARGSQKPEQAKRNHQSPAS